MTEKNNYITDFDSSTTMFKTLSCFLSGRDFPGSGIAPQMPSATGHLINALPVSLRTSIYRAAGWWGALTEDRMQEVDSEDIASWVVSHYPQKKIPGIMIGSSNGAVTHLAAALGIPWFPQTYLLTVRRNMDPDEMEKDAEWGKKMAGIFLPKNPDLLAYQMHDPLQDRLMVQEMGYFRLKRTKLGKAWETYIKENLEPGGILYSVECDYRWLIYKIGERHTFQIGGLGGLTAEEYIKGNPDIDRFLKNQKGNKVNKWCLPQKPFDGEEAEWGFAPALLDDMNRFARENGYKVRRICFNNPEDISPLVADLYRWWYQKIGWSTGRLLTECFALLDQLWAFKTESIPFWLAFNTNCSLKTLESYIQASGPFREIYLILMSNAVENAIGLVSYEQWRKAIGQAQEHSDFIGVNETKYPADLGTFFNYHEELKRKLGEQREVPLSLKITELEEFLKEKQKAYRVEWR